MFKQVDITPAIKAKLVAAAGRSADDDVGDLAVFEAEAVNTKPLVRRKGGLFQNAVLGHDVIELMHKHIDSGDTIPLAQMHTHGIPTGRVFASAVRAHMGHSALHTQFYVPVRDTEITSKLNNGIIKDVSVGFRAAKLLCSDCGFDYAAPEATFENLWDCTCPNGHKIGQNGTHLRLHGLDKFDELSLVDRGASTGAEILPRSKQTFSATPENIARLTAQGFDHNLIQCRFSLVDTEGGPLPIQRTSETMMTEAEILNLKAEGIVAARDRDELKTKLTAVETARTELQTKLAAAEARITELSSGDVAKTQAKLTAVEAEVTQATTFIDERLKAAFAITGQPNTALPTTMADKVAKLSEMQTALAAAIPTGGVGKPAATGSGSADEQKTGSFAAFKRK